MYHRSGFAEVLARLARWPLWRPRFGPRPSVRNPEVAAAQPPPSNPLPVAGQRLRARAVTMQLCNGRAPRLPHRNRAHIVGAMCLG